MSEPSSAKAHLLNAIRRHRLPAAELPPHDGPWIEYPDRVTQFVESVRSVGGTVVFSEDEAQLNAQLAEWEPYARAKVRCSQVQGVGENDVDWSLVTDPHSLQDIDIAVVPGAFGVAENGAVWLDDRVLPQRVLPFLVQHLVLVVPRQRIHDNLHQAYAIIAMGERPFGVFISGPSKTADIEQSLVIGAHGARSLLVALLGPAPAESGLPETG